MRGTRIELAHPLRNKAFVMKEQTSEGLPSRHLNLAHLTIAASERTDVRKSLPPPHKVAKNRKSLKN